MEQQKLPNVTAVLILGVFSIITFCCYGVIGLIPGIIALVLANGSKKTYLENPELYSGYSTLKTGKILAIIGIILNILMLILVIGFISYVGWDTLQDPEKLQEILEAYK